jgi:hypothetical protein
MTATISKPAESTAHIPITSKPTTGILTEAQWVERWGIALTDDPQAFAELPREAYDELPAYNYSFLKTIWSYCPFKAWLEFRDPNRPARERKEHFLHGDLHHCHLLEPEKYESRYAIAPEDAPKRPTEAQLAKLIDVDMDSLGIIPSDMPKRPTQKQVEAPKPKSETSTTYEKWLDVQERAQRWAEWEAQNPGKKPVTAEESAELASISYAAKFWSQFDAENAGKELISTKDAEFGAALANSVLSHPRFSSLFANTPENRRGNELTLSYIHPFLGVRIKARIDALRLLASPYLRLWVGDLKGTKDARPGAQGFGKEVANFGYLMQAAFYHDAVVFCRAPIERILQLSDGALDMVPVEFEFVASEKAIPRHEFVSGHTISEATHPREMSLGRQAASAALTEAVWCDSSGHWPGYDVAAQPLEVPEWVLRQMEARLAVLGEEGL